MFINLTARKDIVEFYITSSEVVQERHPEATHDEVLAYLVGQAHSMLERGWNVEIKQEVL